jgi:cell division transport system permease protein
VTRALATLRRLLALLGGDSQADRAVPPTGFTARLTLFTAGAMAFLAVFALALSMATGRLADRWGAELARTATLRLSAPEGQMAAQTAAALAVLAQTPGVAASRALTPEENRALLEPWFGPDLPVEALPIPQLVEITLEEQGFDAAGLRARLQAEVPGAVLDDHTRWRAPLTLAAARLRSLGVLALGLIALSTAAMITLAAQAALAANAQVIRVLRLVGAQDAYIARAFVRRFTLRALWGALAGTAAGLVAVWMLPAADTTEGFLTGLGFRGAGWLWPLLIPPFAALVAFAATRGAALATLRAQS